ncbi:MAG: Peptide methionine sulfoxide reductase [uncultured Sulfurovum sp.]|uniref:Peptide methionine sulfoxide reductase n=1 Tax=uncultured Sulfurovum sp. TaxID=269237 RepID=A0A6S6UBT7_9BACT|nr:MAG: Peptide methionine sulfoxide reductase [uncultured Sulfurovum sp.]
MLYCYIFYFCENICYNSNMNNTDFHKNLQTLPNGANYIFYNEKRYLLIKDTLLNGKLIKVYAEELGGNDIVSGNYYTSIKDGILKPCEMSDKKVIDFVLRAVII